MRRTAPLLLLGSLAACTVGPDYAGPPVTPTAAQFRRADAAVQAPPKMTDWWNDLGDPALARLVDRALAGNFDLAAAEARLAQARALLRERRADTLPSGTIGADYARSRPSFAAFGDQLVPGLKPDDLDLYSLSYDASWEIDLFGRKRRTVEASVRDLETRTAELDDVRLMVATETAQAYVALRQAQRRLQLDREAEQVQSRQFTLITERERLGVASDLDVQRVSALLDSTRAAIPSAEADIGIALDRLAVLTGAAPGAVDDLAGDAAAIPAPPEAVAIGDPAELLRRRPDIRAAERRLAAATARIGINAADLFPTISLRGIIGLQANALGGLGDGLNYSAGPSLRWLFPDFGAIRARVEAATGRRDEQLALYQGSVVAALRDAEGAALRFARLGDEVTLRARAEASARRAAMLAETRYRAGAGSLIDMLDAERERVRSSVILADAQAARTAAFVTLQKSLGLGWQQKVPNP